MRVFFESTFDILYLLTITFLGFRLIKTADSKEKKLFGFLTLILGFGDSFHLIPRVIALVSGNGFEPLAPYLGFGKFMTSITMTIFYVLLYHVYLLRYKVKSGTSLTYTVYSLALIRIFLCLLPQNHWFVYRQPLDWGIYRNIPFLILGIIIIVIFFKASRKHNDLNFKHMWLTIVLSFGFYIPVVLFAGINEAFGLLMIPKTMAYVWTVMIGYNTYMKKR